MNLIAQQGDVLIFEVDYKVEGDELDHLILAHGESGHTHQLTNGLGKLIMMDNIMHLKIFSDTALLKHGEHSMKNTIKNFKEKEDIPINYIEYLKNNEGIDFDNLNFDEIVFKTKHEIVLKQGDYRIGRVFEYDHFLEESRELAD